MHINDILQLAAQAWHDTKDAADPEFNDCALTHRENLAAAAKAVVDSEQAFNAFDRAVLKHYLERREAQSEAERILEANSQLHADEVMHIASGTPHPLHAEDAQRAAVREEFKPQVVGPTVASHEAINVGSKVTVSEAAPAKPKVSKKSPPKVKKVKPLPKAKKKGKK